jgi:hypothetical protein
VLVLLAGTLVANALLALRLAGVAATPAAWPVRRRRIARIVVGVLAVASWLFQLHRFGWM